MEGDVGLLVHRGWPGNDQVSGSDPICWCGIQREEFKVASTLVITLLNSSKFKRCGCKGGFHISYSSFPKGPLSETWKNATDY